MSLLTVNAQGVPTRLESILVRELELGAKKIKIVGGASSVSIGWLLSNLSSKEISGLPHLVVVPRLEDAQAFISNLRFICGPASVSILPHFDVSPYLGLYPKHQAIAARMRFLHSAQNAKPSDVFVAPIGSLLQKTLPFKILSDRTTRLRIDYDLPTNITSWLSGLGYLASPIVEDVGQYSQRGGILDIYSPAHDLPIRIELFGDTVASLRSFNPETQHSFEELASYVIIPCRETLWLDENLDYLLSIGYWYDKRYDIVVPFLLGLSNKLL